MTDLIPYLSLAVAIVACGISTFVALRAGRWRESDSAKALILRVESIERTCDGHAAKLIEHAEDISRLPTKADFARLEGEIRGTGRVADRTEQAVVRIENYLLSNRP